jgi:hypothetical protein
VTDASVNTKRKSLGKLSPEQLGRLLKLSHEMPSLGDLGVWLLSRPKFIRMLAESGAVFHWAWAYELSLPELIGLMVYAAGDVDDLMRIADADDPQEAVLSLAESTSNQPDDADDTPAWHRLLVIELLVAVIKCIECYRSYSESVCDLVAKARAGDRAAILKAVRIDPSVLASPSIAEQVSLAVLESDKQFLKQVKGAYATPRKKLAVYTDLRFVGVLLREAEAFEHAPSEHIYDVVVNRFGLYDQRGGDARKGLLTLFKRWQESATT